MNGTQATTVPKKESCKLRSMIPCAGHLCGEKWTRRTLLCLVFLMGWPRLTLGADWPQWRGPDRNGVAPESPPLADEWPGTGPRLGWQNGRLMHGGVDTGHSSPVVAAGRVYLYGSWLDFSVPEGASDEVACLSASTG